MDRYVASLDPRLRPQRGKGLVHIEQLWGSQDVASHVIAMIMNAQECRTLTATCMHIVWLTLCMFNIRSIELHTLHLNRVLDSIQ